jgi:hypothetical protein
MRIVLTLVVLALVDTLLVGRLRADDGKPDKDGYAPLFGAPTWFIHRGKQNTWGTYDDGTIFTHRGGGGWYMTKKDYANFDLHLEIKLSANADTGIAFRNSTDTDPSFDGNQIQVVDAAISEKWPADSQTGGIIGVVGPPKKAVLKPTGEWNAVDILAKGDKLRVKVNDATVLDVGLADFKHKTKQHPDLLRKTGHIGLQSWDGLVEFRNLKIKELPE